MKTIVIIGEPSNSSMLLELMMHKIDLPIIVIGEHPKKEEVYELVPNRLNFDLDTNPVSMLNHSFKSVQKRNAFFNKRKR